MEKIHIKKLRTEDMDQTARMLALAFKANPNMKAVWPDPGTEKALRAVAEVMKTVKLKRKYSNVYVAKVGERVVGAVNFAVWPDCQPGGAEKLRMFPTLLALFGTKLPKAFKVLSAWEKHDPPKPHFHIGPLAVLPRYQGNGIGSRLLRHCLKLADDASVPCYLETDSQLNLPLYKRHGFSVVKEIPVHGYLTWLMWRNVKAGQDGNPVSAQMAGEPEAG